MNRHKRKRDGTRFVCKCQCGGDVRGTRSFGRLWTYCEKCSPVVTIKLPVKIKDASNG